MYTYIRYETRRIKVKNTIFNEIIHKNTICCYLISRYSQLCDLIMPDSIEPAYTGHCAPNTRPPSPGHDTEWDTFMQSIEQEKQMVDAHFNSEVEQYRIFLEKHGPPKRDDGGGGFGRKGYTKI